MAKEALLKVENLVVEAYDSDRGVGRVVDGVSFEIGKGEVLGITGESACGKTTLAFSILRLIGNSRTETLDPQRMVGFSGKLTNRREITSGRIFFEGTDLLGLSEEQMRSLRAREISMVFQDPIDSLNPIMMIGRQVGEPKEAHEKIKWEQLKEIVFDYLGKVELADMTLRHLNDPSTFSRGEGQRIMIAMALICNPSLLIADEPTSSLDARIQRQVIDLIKRFKKEFDLSMLYITHDLGVVFEVSDHIAVMYAGKIVESGDAKTIYQRARHPYTIGLKNAYPDFYAPRKRLKSTPGCPPTPFDRSQGCKFFPRCEYAKPMCSEKNPPEIELEPGHLVSCFRTNEITD